MHLLCSPNYPHASYLKRTCRLTHESIILLIGSDLKNSFLFKEVIKGETLCSQAQYGWKSLIAGLNKVQNWLSFQTIHLKTLHNMGANTGR